MNDADLAYKRGYSDGRRDCEDEIVGLESELAAVKRDLDRYKSYYDRISKLPDCNECGRKENCEYLPRYGDYCRINCPFWKE